MSKPNCSPLNDNTPQKIGSLKDSPYHYPVPQSEDSDPWDTCHKLLVKEDEAQCDAWRGEIQNLLIFAGLFSGVVTAFVLDSYKSLQPDPSDTTNFLLTQLVSQSYGKPPPLPFVVTHTSTRVNVFWFLSLMLALATVLIGITAMQWLSQYQRYSGSLTKKETLAQRNMRFEGLQRWHVPKIIAGLPLLLQGALVLFFAGMIDFLISLANRALTISVTTVMAITLLFMLLTTVLPAFQHIWLEVGLCSTSVSPPCPYKSPQSWLFLRFAFSTAAHIVWAFGVVAVYAPLFVLSLLKGIPPVLDSFLKRIFYVKQVLSWDEFECHCLDIRDFRGREDSASRPTGPQLFRRRPAPAKDRKVEFDAAHGVARVVHQHVLDDHSAYAAYNCFNQLEMSAVGSSFFSVLWEEAPDEDKQCRSLVSPKTSSEDQISVVRNARGILFLAQFRQTLQVNAEHVFVKDQLLELYIRVCEFLFAGDLHTSSKFDYVTGISFSALPLVSSSLGDDEVFRGIGTAQKLRIIKILATFVHSVISNPPADDSDITRFYLNGPLRRFMESTHLILLDDLRSPPPQPSSLTTHGQAQAHDQTMISKFGHLLHDLATHLEQAHPGRSHLALSIAARYLYQFSWNKVYTERTVACQQYPEYVRSVKAINDACRSFRDRYEPDAVRGVLDDVYSARTVDSVIRESLSQDERQGLRERSGQKSHGVVSGLDVQRQASQAAALNLKDHKSAGPDASTTV